MTINNDVTSSQNMRQFVPFTMQVNDAADYFGYHPKTIYKMIYSGKILYGIQYLKVGGKVLIKTEDFKKWLHEQAGVGYGSN